MTVEFWKKPGAAMLLVVVALLGPSMPSQGQERADTYDVLDIGTATYSNVVVQTRTKTDLFVKHANGFANIKVKDLDRSTQLRLGYVVEIPPTNTPSGVSQVFKSPKFQLDPRFEEWAEQIVWESREALAPIPIKYLYGAAGILVLLYLLFCNCCRLICRKSEHEPKYTALVWLPLFKQIPLLKAAGMSAGWFLLNFLPPLAPIVFIVWCFKIAKARGKSAVIGWLLLLPGFNLFAFLFLALSRGAKDQADDDRPDRGVITLYHDKHRSAV